MNDDMEKYLGKFALKSAPPALKAEIISAARSGWEQKENFFCSFFFLKIYAGLAAFIIICCCFANYYTNSLLLKSFKDFHYKNRLESSINEIFASDEDADLRKRFQRIAILMKEKNDENKKKFLEKRRELINSLIEGEQS